MKRVVFIQRLLTPYRIPFYRSLHKLLAQRNIDLRLIYGQPVKDEPEAWQDLDIATKTKNRYIYLGSRYMVWTSGWKYIRNADLVIAQQHNNNLNSYPLIPIRKLLGFKLALFGHGKNYQSKNPQGLEEKFKRFFSRHVDWWFTYNDLSAREVAKLGFPENRITSVLNSMDTTDSIETYDQFTQKDVAEFRETYKIPQGAPTGIFCSRLYKAKRIKFLLECLQKIKQQCPNFQFIMIGTGELFSEVEKFQQKNSDWFHAVGESRNDEKIKLFRLADFQLMPSYVGLHIVDSFAMLTPMITTNITNHGPEIDYLTDKENGIISENNSEEYVKTVLNYLEDKELQEKLIQGCHAGREKYSIENMAKLFADGIEQALSK